MIYLVKNSGLAWNFEPRNGITVYFFSNSMFSMLFLIFRNRYSIIKKQEKTIFRKLLKLKKKILSFKNGGKIVTLCINHNGITVLKK